MLQRWRDSGETFVSPKILTRFQFQSILGGMVMSTVKAMKKSASQRRVEAGIVGYAKTKKKKAAPKAKKWAPLATNYTNKV